MDDVTVKRIEFHGSLSSVLPRRLWQGLFDVYRKHGCQLERMDNMLIDLDHCKDVFAKLASEDEVKFYWACHSGGWQTKVDTNPRFPISDYFFLRDMSVVVIAKVTKDYAELKELVLNDDE